jgi:hypothetical protein
MKQEQPPDSHDWAGRDKPGDGAARVRGCQFAGERVPDGARGSELRDRRRGSSGDGFARLFPPR